MLCSAKSGSTWLDRLRSSKGIPTGDGLDLDSFLLNSSHSFHPRPPKPTRNRTRTTDTPPTMTTVLAELFNMGAALSHKKKCPRKQTNPKFFLAPEAESLERREEGEQNQNENEKEENNELKGFTKSEVTMIDTSLPGWKVERLVFRKNTVWKVRERKQKSKFFANKKKKKSKGTLTNTCGIGIGIGTSKDNTVNMRGEKPVKTYKEIESSPKEVSRKIKKGKTSLHFD